MHRSAIGFALVSVVVAAYARGVSSAIFWDDAGLLAAADRLEHWWQAFQPYSLGLYDEQHADGAKFWRPLVTLSLFVERGLLQEESRVWGHHLSNLLLHLSVTLLAWRWLVRMSSGRLGDGMAGACAALWAVIPLKAENVAWISGRGDMMGALFLLVGLQLFSSVRSPALRAATALSCILLALLCKELYVVAPVFLAMEWMVAGQSGSRKLPGSPSPVRAVVVGAAQLPLVVWGAGLLVVAFLALRVLWIGLEGGGSAMLATLGVADRLRLMLESVGHGCLTALAPLSPRILRGPIGFSAPGQLQGEAGFALAGALVLVLSALAAYRHRVVRPALCVFWITLLPVSNLVPTGLEARMSDRYLYLPTLGVVLLGGELLQSAIRRLGVPRVAAAAVWAASAALALLCSMRANLFAHPARLWSLEASRPDAAATVLSNAAQSALTQNQVLRARDLEAAVARRYLELGYAEGLPHALNAARLNAEFWGEGVRGPLTGFGRVLECLLQQSPTAIPVPFPPNAKQGIQIPCSGPEAQGVVAVQGAQLDAELQLLHARLGRPVGDALRRLESTVGTQRGHRALAMAWLNLGDPDAAKRVVGLMPLSNHVRQELERLLAAFRAQDSPAGRRFLANAHARNCHQPPPAAVLSPTGRKAVSVSCALAGRAPPDGYPPTRSLTPKQLAHIRMNPLQRVEMLANLAVNKR